MANCFSCWRSRKRPKHLAALKWKLKTSRKKSWFFFCFFKKIEEMVFGLWFCDQRWSLRMLALFFAYFFHIVIYAIKAKRLTGTIKNNSFGLSVLHWKWKCHRKPNEQLDSDFDWIHLSFQNAKKNEIIRVLQAIEDIDFTHYAGAIKHEQKHLLWHFVIHFFFLFWTLKKQQKHFYVYCLFSGCVNGRQLKIKAKRINDLLDMMVWLLTIEALN